MLNLKRERERQAQLNMKRDGKAFWRPEDGDKNLIRVLKFKHKVTKEDVASKLYPKDSLGEVAEEWCYPVVMHFGLTASNFPVHSTPEIMAAYEKLAESDDETDKKNALLIRPNKKYAMNIVDLNAPGKGVQIYLAPVTIRTEIGKFVLDEDYGDAVLGLKGRDWKIIYNKSEGPKSMYKVIMREKDKCRPMNAAIEKAIKDLYDPEVNEEFASRKSMDELDVPGQEEHPKPKKDNMDWMETPSKAKNGKKEEEGFGDIFDKE